MASGAASTAPTHHGEKTLAGRPLWSHRGLCRAAPRRARGSRSARCSASPEALRCDLKRIIWIPPPIARSRITLLFVRNGLNVDLHSRVLGYPEPTRAAFRPQRPGARAPPRNRVARRSRRFDDGGESASFPESKFSRPLD